MNLKDRKNVFLSIVVPTFNGEAFLEECLSSLKNQTFKDYEIIVSDGDSEDNTLKIASQYADKIVVSNKRGVAFQQNNGIKVARGKAILVVHQDVALAPNYAEYAVDALNSGFILGKARTLPKSGSFTLKTYFSINNFLEISYQRKTHLWDLSIFLEKKIYF